MDIVRGFNRGCGRSSARVVNRLLVTSILISGASAASAQVTPADVRPPTREQVTRPTEPTPNAHARLEVEGGIERAPCALDGPQYKDIRLTVRGAEFENLQGLPAAELNAAYAPYVGRDEPISVVCEIRDRAATILRNAGYIAAVQVP